jgi:hypothetical protein
MRIRPIIVALALTHGFAVASDRLSDGLPATPAAHCPVLLTEPLRPAAGPWGELRRSELLVGAIEIEMSCGLITAINLIQAARRIRGLEPIDATAVARRAGERWCGEVTLTRFVEMLKTLAREHGLPHATARLEVLPGVMSPEPGVIESEWFNQAQLTPGPRVLKAIGTLVNHRVHGRDEWQYHLQALADRHQSTLNVIEPYEAGLELRAAPHRFTPINPHVSVPVYRYLGPHAPPSEFLITAVISFAF